MRQEERNRIKREKIMAAALREFGSKTYAEASINAICAEEGLSKGIVYHYYEDKDALYLACLDESLTAMMTYLKEHMPPLEGGTEEKLDDYFAVRLRFLEEHYMLYVIYTNSTAEMQSAVAAGNPAEREELCKQWVLTLLYGVVEH